MAKIVGIWKTKISNIGSIKSRYVLCTRPTKIETINITVTVNPQESISVDMVSLKILV